MLGQAEFFIQFAPIKVPYGIKRYTDEGSRLFSVIEDGLAAGSNGWLVGGKFSIVDINVFAWARGHPWVDESRFPRVFKWLKDVGARDGVQKGLTVPKAPAQPTAEENAKAAKEVKEWVAQAEAELEALKARQ
jgi:glutathione S-transferase